MERMSQRLKALEEVSPSTSISIEELAAANKKAIDSSLAAFAREQDSAITLMSDKQKIFNTNIGRSVAGLVDSVGATESRYRHRRRR